VYSTLVQLSIWHLLTTRVFFQGSVENLAATEPDVLSPQVEYKVTHSSSSAAITITSSCTLVVIKSWYDVALATLLEPF